jgi:competence protein ComEC
VAQHGQDAQQDSKAGTVENRARAGTSTWPVGGRVPWSGGWDVIGRQSPLAVPARIRDWAAAEFGAGRMVPWLAVAYCFGDVVYFSAEREPAVWAALALASIGVTIAIMARRRSFGFPLAAALAALTVSFAGATLHTAWIAHPVLRHPAWGIAVTGFVAAREEREHNDRIVVRTRTMEGRGLDPALARVRIVLRPGTAPPVGSFVTFKADLLPPLSPLRPGGYDFARDMYFSALGASGFVLGGIKTAAPPAASGDAWLRTTAAVEAMRDGIDQRIRAVIPGDEGAIASAVITGKRGEVSPEVKDAFYVSSLVHVLAIAGFHMAVVTGLIFFFVRGGLALIPSLASRQPIKKWAAAIALLAAAFYLVLSGAGTATQRAFIMVAIVLTGIMVDRPTLTFRTVSIAAFAVLTLAPQAVLTPSFQLSFAATLALIAAYQYGLPLPHAGTASGWRGRLALWGWREVATIAFTSVVAGLATLPYAAYNFHRVAPYGVLANVLAMPVVSVWVMPMGILGVLTLPLGFDAVFWRLMGDGIGWIIGVVLWVAHLPGAVGAISVFGTGPLLLCTAGLLLLCLLRTPLRLGGVPLMLVAAAWALTTPRPDLLVSADGESVALRGANGRLAVLHVGRDAFAVEDWLVADGDTRDAHDKSLRQGIGCDPSGCIGTLGDGAIVAYAVEPEAFEDDCARAAVILAVHDDPPPDCTATVIKRETWYDRGALALRRDGAGFVIESARPQNYDRPWAPAWHARSAQFSDPATSAERNAAPRDATPAQDDIEADQ